MAEEKKDRPMRMIEAEAKKRRCPMGIEDNCIGSECHGWRWIGKEPTGYRESEGFCGAVVHFPSR